VMLWWEKCTSAVTRWVAEQVMRRHALEHGHQVQAWEPVGFSRFNRSQLLGLLLWLEFVKSSLLALRFRRGLLLSWYKCQTFWSNRV
jgi:hypothetical protein